MALTDLDSSTINAILVWRSLNIIKTISSDFNIVQKPMRILSASLVILLILAFSQGVKANQPPKPEFTIETLPADKGPIDARIWSIGDSIRIVEAMSLPNTCDTVAGEVNFQDNNTEVFVKLKPESQDSPAVKDCHPTDVPVAVSVTIPHMPFVVGCHHNITLETPQGIKTHGVTIIW